MSENKRDAETIILGSGDLMIKEYTGAIPDYTDFTEADLLGRIQGGATLEYKGTWYEAKDDTGKAVKTIMTEEEATLKSGIITWNGKTLKHLCSTARVTEADGIRTVKIGGVGNHDGKSYALCFHHTDRADGDIWLVIRGVNQAGFSLAFAKDKETVIDAEFKCLPQDEEGTLIQYIEEIAQTV
ncbi:hypothetical protein AALA22_10665 [Anaerovoracaceae bacterium 41-7]|uniref:hypothetical protein n=1 Tax=Emergencia sp. JLR.KK010 TaxID=3114296 RepID=UPI0030D22ED3